MSRFLSPWQIWRWPLLLGLLSLVGLVAALVADGPGDALSWAALGVPAGVCAWAFGRGRAPAPPRTAPRGRPAAVRPARTRR